MQNVQNVKEYKTDKKRFTFEVAGVFFIMCFYSLLFLFFISGMARSAWEGNLLDSRHVVWPQISVADDATAQSHGCPFFSLVGPPEQLQSCSQPCAPLGVEVDLRQSGQHSAAIG